MASSKTISKKFRVLPDGVPFTLKGREAWALSNLIKAGKRGCTPIDHPGPRWSAYVHALRTERGLIIETEHEPHGGPFPGSHARYRLVSEVEALRETEKQV